MTTVVSQNVSHKKLFHLIYSIFLSKGIPQLQFLSFENQLICFLLSDPYLENTHIHKMKIHTIVMKTMRNNIKPHKRNEHFNANHKFCKLLPQFEESDAV